MQDKCFVHDNTIFDSDEPLPIPSYLVILNRKMKKDLYMKIKGKVNRVLCADGGANWLFDVFSDEEER